MAASSDFSAAWRIYDDYRRSLFYTKYFEAHVLEYQTWIVGLNIVIAIGTSTTGIAGWALWSDPGFAVIWAALAGVAATLAVVKPILKWEDVLVRLTRIFGDHDRIAAEYDDLVGDMAVRQRLDEDIKERYAALRKKTAAIERLPLKPRPALTERLKSEVIREKPVEGFWSPAKPKRKRKG